MPRKMTRQSAPPRLRRAPKATFTPFVLSGVVPPDEEYVAHFTYEVEGRVIVLTRASLLKLDFVEGDDGGAGDAGGAGGAGGGATTTTTAAGGADDGGSGCSGGGYVLRWRKNLREITAVAAEGSVLRLWFVPDKLNLKKDVRTYDVGSVDFAATMALALDRVVRDAWQAEFEARVARDGDEVYQTHTLAYKVNRKGKMQLRFLLATTKAVYNVEPASVRQWEVGKVKWSVPVAGLRSAVVLRDDPCRVVVRLEDENSGKRKPVKEEVTFICDHAGQARQLVHSLNVLQRRFGVVEKSTM